jgi:hypothetical protein
MDGRSVKLTLKHDPRRGSIELRRFDLVSVGPRAATTRTSRSGHQVASRGFDVLSGRLDHIQHVLQPCSLLEDSMELERLCRTENSARVFLGASAG